MQIKFSDSSGTTLDVLAVNGNSIVFQGATRDSLEIQIAKTVTTIDALDKLTVDSANTKKLTSYYQEKETYTDGTSKMLDRESVHDNYSLRVSLALKPVVTAAATSTTAAVTEDRLCVTLAQKTYAEIQAEQQAAQITALGTQVATLSLGGTVS